MSDVACADCGTPVGLDVWPERDRKIEEASYQAELKTWEASKRRLPRPTPRPVFCSKACFRRFRDHLHGQVHDDEHKKVCIDDHGEDPHKASRAKASAARWGRPGGA